MGAQLPEREVTAKYIDTEYGECFSEGDQQWSVAIPTGSMGEHQGIPGLGASTMKVSTHGHLAWVLVHERFCREVSHKIIIAEITPHRSTEHDIASITLL